jgi:hypothetical protein
MGDDLYTQLQTWPKIDLHIHLKGSFLLKTHSDIASGFGIDIPIYDLELICLIVHIINIPLTLIKRTILYAAKAEIACEG